MKLKVVTVNSLNYYPKKLARTLVGYRVERAMRNAERSGFNEKFTHPRSLRNGQSIKP